MAKRLSRRALSVAEVGMALALDRSTLPSRYGILTPASALENTVQKALERGGLSFRFD